MSNYVISISREFGSGGRLIGKQLAARLGIPCYDRTLILKTGMPWLDMVGAPMPMGAMDM